MKVKISRQEVMSMNNALLTIKEPKDVSFPAQFKHAQSKTKRLLKNEVMTSLEVVQDKVKPIREAKEKIDLEYCVVREGADVEKEGIKALKPEGEEGNDRKALFLNNLIQLDLYEYLDDDAEKEATDKFIAVLEEYKDLFKELNEYTKEIVTVEVHEVSCEYVPDLDENIHDSIVHMITD